MVPFLCEITLCCIVSYHLALLLMQGEKRSDKRAIAGKDAVPPAANRWATRSDELSAASADGHPLRSD